MSIFLGHDRSTGSRFYLPVKALHTHLHVQADTGRGKTVTLESIIHQLVRSDPHAPIFIFDRMGAHFLSLVLWFTSRFCPPSVRERVILINPASQRVVMPFNPLRCNSSAESYYRAIKACDSILRAWPNQNMGEMPRLSRWLQNAMFAVAQLGLTISDAAHLLTPGSPYHEPMLRSLPPLLRAEWAEIENPRGVEKLESTQNRMKPWKDLANLRNMFGSVEPRFDARRFMQQANIVLVNLSPQNILPSQASDAIGGLMLLDLFTTVRSLLPNERRQTYVILDEFQRFVGPDFEEAIPELRQCRLSLVLSHQQLSQLKREHADLSSLIFQCQSRILLGLQGEDADIHAQILSSLDYDPRRIKDEFYSRRQLIDHHDVIHLRSWSQSESEAKNWSETYGTNWSATQGTSRSSGWNSESSNSMTRQFNAPLQDYQLGTSRGTGRNLSNSNTESEGSGGNQSKAEGGSTSHSTSESVGESLLPVYEQFRELSKRMYFTPEEQRAEWARDIRRLRTGQAFVRLVNDPKIYGVDIARHMPGHLAWDLETITRRYPAAIEAVDAFIEKNDSSEYFVSPAVIERETEERLQRILNPVIHLPAPRPEENPLA